MQKLKGNSRGDNNLYFVGQVELEVGLEAPRIDSLCLLAVDTVDIADIVDIVDTVAELQPHWLAG